MLLIDVPQIPPEGLAVDAVLTPALIHVEGENSFDLEAGGRLVCRVEKGDGESVHVRGRLGCGLGVDCSRCLERFAYPVAQELDLFYLPRVAGLDAEEDAELSDRELVVSYYEGTRIDLGEMLREQLLLALPMKRLCRPECAGLCPGCGTNRNRSTCTCVSVDEHFSPFAKLVGKGTAS
jgi:DUF177 domain-containing protein